MVVVDVHPPRAAADELPFQGSPADPPLDAMIRRFCLLSCGLFEEAVMVEVRIFPCMKAPKAHALDALVELLLSGQQQLLVIGLVRGDISAAN